MALEVRDSSGMNVVGEAAHEQTLSRYRDYVSADAGERRPVAQNKIGPELREHQRRRAADPARRPGHQHAAVLHVQRGGKWWDG